MRNISNNLLFISTLCLTHISTALVDTPVKFSESASKDWTCGYAAKLGLSANDLIFKKDHYPSLHKDVLQAPEYNVARLMGAPNYRPSRASKSLYGTAQPSVEGLREFFEESKEQNIIWFNLREEVVVYFSGYSFNLRAVTAPFKNLSLAGMSAQELEQTEKCIVENLKRNRPELILVDESVDMKVIPALPIDYDDIQTVAEVFAENSHWVKSLQYVRIPITDEKSAEMADLKAIAKSINEAKLNNPNVAITFNCHAGRGRTTQGMIVASLVANPQAILDELIELEGHLKNLKKDIQKASTPKERADFEKRIATLEAFKMSLQKKTY
ncbi:MAG: hypothetical protein R3A80_02955 [Bdellovibrionota bacterium]